MISHQNEGYVKSENHGGITTVEFFHPQSNSLPAGLLEELTTQIHGAGNDEETRVIVLRSAGNKAFCAGASFDELLAIKEEQQGFLFFSGFAHLINTMRKCPKFIIARIQGKCVGGGVGLAAAADYSIAVEGADIKLSELSIGIGPFVVGPVIEKKMGGAAFQALSIDASMWRNADWARKRGLYAELHVNADYMDESLNRLTNNLSHAHPQAMAEMKKMFWEGTDHWDQLLLERATLSGRLAVSEFTRKAIHALRKKS